MDEFVPALSPELSVEQVSSWDGPLCECNTPGCRTRLPTEAWLFVEGAHQAVVLPEHASPDARKVYRDGFVVEEDG